MARQAGVTAALCLFAWLALLPHAGVAQDRSPSQSPDELWKAYPLDPTATPGVESTAVASPTARAGPDRPSGAAARRGNDDGLPIVLVLLTLVTAGGTLTILRVLRRRGSEPDAAASATADAPVAAVPVTPALWHGRSGRFARATRGTSASRAPEAVATVASLQDARRREPQASGDAPVPDAAAGPPRGHPTRVTPIASATAGTPPDRRLGWTAEIEWRHTDGKSRFCAIARGAGTTTVAQSPPLEWPPTGPSAVQAMTDAAEKLAATLTAAGWKPLPSSGAWYAKRFAWDPAGAEAGPVTPTSAVAVKPVGRLHRAVRAVLRHRLAVAGLCVLVALGLITALQLGNGDRDATVAQPTQTPATPATGTPAAADKKPKPKSPDDIDLTVPLLVLLGLACVALMIRQTRAAVKAEP